MTEQEKSKDAKGMKKWIIILVIAIFVLIIGGLSAFQYLFFKAKAEGIAIGYERAAAAAYQMGRPIPDNIFEEGNYRVEIKSTPATGGQPFSITINVRDRYTNITHYSYSQSVTGQSGLPGNPK